MEEKIAINITSLSFFAVVFITSEKSYGVENPELYVKSYPVHLHTFDMQIPIGERTES